MKKSLTVHTDCLHYMGEKPCRFKRECLNCPHYEPQGIRILIIKLGAMGDALRTTPILPALKKLHPQSHITWVTDQMSYPLLEGIPSINRLFVLNFEARLVLEAERFDRLYCFEKNPLATAFGSLMHATIKKGFAATHHGTLSVYDDDGSYALRLGLSDPFKFHESQRTYQDVLFEMAGLTFQGERYQLFLSETDREHAQRLLHHLGVRTDRLQIGLNTGCGNVFRTKQWPLAAFAELAERLYREFNAEVLLLGGPDEREQNQDIRAMCTVPVFDTGGDNPIKKFAAIIETCDAVVTSDTLAMHLAIALERPAVVLFGSTCPQEIDLYGKGVKLHAGLDCSPCYKHTCETMDCMKHITVEHIVSALRKCLP